MIDRRLLELNLTVLGIANTPSENPTAGTQYIVGETPSGAFAGATTNSIASYDGSTWKFSLPKVGQLEVFNSATSELLRFNGIAWVTVTTIGSSNNIIIETHTITAQEVTNKAFILTNSVAQGQEDKVLLFVSGVAQIAGVDFTASGNSISWNNQGLDSIGLYPGDTFTIQYIKS